MDMIGKYPSRSQAEERAAFLRSRGIATHVTDLTSLRFNAAHQGQFRAAVWALLEPQFEDARALLEDPDHKVKNPLSAEEMAHLESEGQVQAMDALFRATMTVGIVLALVLGTGVVAWLILN